MTDRDTVRIVDDNARVAAPSADPSAVGRAGGARRAPRAGRVPCELAQGEVP